MECEYVKQFSEEIATKEGFKNFTISVKAGKSKGDGFLGDVFMVTIQENDRSLEMVFKCAYTDEKMVRDFCIKDVYDTEKYFYEAIYPALDQFQTQKRGLLPFKSVAKFFGSHFEGSTRMLALENLRSKGFDLFDKKELFDEEHAEFLLKEYAKYHATSFAFKQLCPEEYRKLVVPVADNLWHKTGPDHAFLEMARKLIEAAFEALEESRNKLLIDKFTDYRDRSVDIFLSSAQYKGKYSCILHGDCWSSNMMFKYSVSDLVLNAFALT